MNVLHKRQSANLFFLLLTFVLLQSLKNVSGFKLAVSLHHEENFAAEGLMHQDSVIIPEEFQNHVRFRREVRKSSRLDANQNKHAIRYKKRKGSRIGGQEGPEIIDLRPYENGAKESFLEQYSILFLILGSTVFTIVSFVCLYVCCCKNGPCGCCTYFYKKVGRAGAEKYMAGLRKDSEGEFYFDDLTAEEAAAAGNAAGEIKGLLM